MNRLLALTLALATVAGRASAQAQAPNTLTDQEKQDGWRLLWDGRTTEGWRSAKSDAFPAKGWEMRDGELSVLGQGGGDIVTREAFTNFEFALEFRLTTGANSGVKYFVDPPRYKSAMGLEYQLLDDEHHPDGKRGTTHTLASLYDLIPAPAEKKVLPLGEWNVMRIVARGRHVEHWLNGAKVLEFDRGSPAYREAVAKSKFKSLPAFGESESGLILLQDHGNRVSFRSIKIKP